MILPTTVTAGCVEILLDNKDEIAAHEIMAMETGEDSSKKMIAPYCAVYSDFDSAAQFDESKNPSELPISIYISCHSSEYETSAESFNEAFLMAVKVIRLLVGHYKLKNIDDDDEGLHLRCQSIPIVILKKTAKESVVEVQLEYFINDLLG